MRPPPGGEALIGQGDPGLTPGTMAAQENGGPQGSRAVALRGPQKSGGFLGLPVTSTGKVLLWGTFWNFFPNVFDPQLVESTDVEGKLDT